jgi:signal transduction histidine kinase
VLPLSLGDRVVGALDLTSYDPAGFSESDQNVLQMLADQLTVAIENARAYGREREVIDEMREVDRLRGQFLARMSHQLATYLNTIIGFSQVMLKGLDGTLTELQVKDLEAIRYSGAQLSQLLDDILELASVEVGAIELHYEPVDLADLLNNLREALDSTLINPRLSLDVQAEPGLPTIEADAGRLGQVLSNLVVTATEISREGVITLRVTNLGERVQFIVRAPVVWDGIENDQDISLALSRRLVELHGGRLRIERAAEESTLFCFTLPTIRPSPEPSPALEPEL